MRHIILLLALLLVISTASALPTTGAASAVGSNNFTLSATGVTGTAGWFQWGLKPGASWAHTPNVTASGGAISYTMVGSPIFGCTTYYYRACDSTGCGSELSLMTTAVTPVATTTWSQWAENITANGLDPGNFIWNAMQPYMNVTTPTVFYSMIFAMMFVGVWLRTRGTAVGSTLGVICIGLFASSAIALQVGLSPEFQAVGQAVLYVSLAGIVTSYTFK